MVKKLHLITVVTLISLILAVTQLPTAIKSSIDLATQASGISPLAIYNSALLTCQYDPNISETTTDGTVKILSSTPIGFVPALSIIDASGKTAQSYDLIPTFKCSPKNNSQKFVTSNSYSGSVFVYVVLTDSQGKASVVFRQTVPVSGSNVGFSGNVNVGRVSISASQINQFVTTLGTGTAQLQIFTQPSVTITSNYDPSAGLGANQQSSWTTWSQYATNISIQNLGSGSITVSANNCPPGQKQDSTGKCYVPNVGNQVSSADVKFFYQMAYAGIPGTSCGLGSSAATQGNTCVVSATTSPTIPLTSLNFVGSDRSSLNSLNGFTVQLLLYPKDTTLNLDSANIGYTGSILYQDQTTTKTVNIPSSLIPVTQQGVRLSDGSFAFGKGLIDPAKLDGLMKSNGIQTGATPVPVTITIYATGNFQGHGQNGNFQGQVQSASFQLKTQYVSNTQVSTNGCTLTSDPCNKNTCKDLSGNPISCYIPPATSNSTGNLCWLNPFDQSCATANPPTNPTPSCDLSGNCNPPPSSTNPANNPPCFGDCNPSNTNQQSSSSTTSPPPSSSQNPSCPNGFTCTPVGQFFQSGTPTASATPAGASICPSTMSASDCANYLYGLVNVPALNQNAIIVIIAVILVIAIIVIAIKRSQKQS